MKVVLYFLIISSMILGLFSTFVYLMTTVDPGLMTLSEKASAMLSSEDHHNDETILPPELYVDVENVLSTHSRLVLLALFSTFCYLMTTVNPLPSPTPSGRIKKFGSDDILYPNDVLLSNDNVAFGLEKAGDDYYDDKDVDQKNKSNKLSRMFKLSSEIPKAIYQHAETGVTTMSTKDKVVTNCTRKKDIDLGKTVTQSLKLPLRGLRRSINKENEQNVYMDSSNSLTLEIKVVDRQPKIEIKIISGDKGEKNVRNQGSTNFKIITKGIFPNSTNIALDSKNNTVIQLGENELLVINAFNTFNYENETLLPENSNLEKTDSEKFTLDLENLYTVNLLNDKPDKHNVESIIDEEFTSKSSLISNSSQNAISI